MRAREFVINVPITIKINGDGDPEVDMENLPDPDQKPDVMMSPQQQELELKKASLGKKSIATAQLVDEPDKNQIA